MKNLLAILGYLKKHRLNLTIALIGTAAFTSLTILPPLLIRYLVDDVVKPEKWHLLPVIVAAFIVVPVVAAGLRYFNTQLLIQTSYRFIGEMRLALYERVLGLSVRFFGGKAAGMIVGRVMDDINMLQRLLTANTLQIFVDIIVFVSALSICFSISWQLSLILCTIIFIYLFIYTFYSKKIKTATIAYRSEYDLITGRMQETLSGVRQVRIFNQQKRETGAFLDKMESGLDRALESSLSSSQMNIACNLVTGFGSTIIMTTGAILALHGQITVGGLIAFGSFIWMAVGPAMNLTNVAGELQETFVSIGRILEILDQESDVSPNKNLPRISRGAGAVEFEKVCFSYVPEIPLFTGLTLSIPAGSTVALVGSTGCGKTTCTSLLMRYWDMQSGSILIDGTDIRTVNLRSLRDLFGVVLQNPLLFDGTLAENIAYGWPDAPRSKIIEAAKIAEIHAFAEGLPNGYDTIVGTNGIKLSLGEKQRVSIARAIVKDPLILIMDEATSALDSESEALIQKALARVLKNRTSFIIAHRLTTITQATMIVVMDAGAIIDCGTHDELMRRQTSLYRTYYEQLSGRPEAGNV